VVVPGCVPSVVGADACEACVVVTPAGAVTVGSGGCATSSPWELPPPQPANKHATRTAEKGPAASALLAGDRFSPAVTRPM
jgi:hypothetical protein